jgi:hypothetical protein
MDEHPVTEEATTPDAGDWADNYGDSAKVRTRAGVGLFLATVLVLGAGLGGLVYWFYGQAQKTEHGISLIEEATSVLRADGSFRSVSRVRSLLTESLDYLPGSDVALSKLALLEAHSYVHDADPEAKKRAEAHLAVAEDNDFQKAERYAARALLDLADRKTKKVRTDIQAVIDRGAKAGQLLFVFGVAQTMDGETGAGAAQIQQASGSDAENVWYATASADAAYRDGKTIGAMEAVAPLLAGSAKQLRLRYAALQMHYDLMFGRSPGGAYPKNTSEVLKRLKSAEESFKKACDNKCRSWFGKRACVKGRGMDASECKKLETTCSKSPRLSKVGEATLANTYAEAYYRLGWLDKAKAELAKVAKAIGGQKLPMVVATEKAKAELLRGRIALVEKDLVKAEKHLRKALTKVDLTNPAAAAQAVDDAIAVGAPDLAEAMFKLYEQSKYRRNGKALAGKALINVRADNFKGFVWKIEIALARGRAAKDSKKKSGYADTILNEKTGLVEQALSSNAPSSARRTLNILKANTHIMRGDRKAAQTVYENWLGNEPKQMKRPEVQEGLARLYIADKKATKEAETAIKGALNLYAGKGYDIYTQRRMVGLFAKLYRSRGKTSLARKYQAKADGK